MEAQRNDGMQHQPWQFFRSSEQTMSNDDINPHRPPEVELNDTQYVGDAAMILVSVMFGTFFACVYCSPYKNLHWVHHVCFALFFLYSIYRWHKSRSWCFIIPTVVSIGLWMMLDAMTYAPIGG